MSFGYVPTDVPEGYDAQWLAEEFARLSALLIEPRRDHVVANPLAVEPVRPTEGMTVFADGVNWNPGFGPGLYVYNTGRWEPMTGRDFFFEVAAGNVPGHTGVSIIGRDDNIKTTLSTAGNNLGTLHTYSTSADIDSISSENAGDTHDLVITGLDANYVAVAPQTVTLNGQTRVALTTPLFRVTTIVNQTGTATAGVIWVYANTALSGGKPTDTTKIRKSVQMTAGVISNEISTSSSYTIPAGKTGMLVFGKTTVTDSKALELTFWVRPPGGVFIIAHHIDVKDNNYDYFFKLPGKIFEKSDLEVRATVTSGTADVAIAYDLILVDNT